MAFRPADTRERAAAALRVASCVAFCSVWVALHWSQIDGLHWLWVPSAAAVGLHKWRRHGLAAARDEVCGALYDFLRPAAACLRAWHDPSWRESYQRLMLALNTVVLLQDGKPGYEFTVTPDTVKAQAALVKQRLSYLVSPQKGK